MTPTWTGQRQQHSPRKLQVCMLLTTWNAKISCSICVRELCFMPQCRRHQANKQCFAYEFATRLTIDNFTFHSWPYLCWPYRELYREFDCSRRPLPAARHQHFVNPPFVGNPADHGAHLVPRLTEFGQCGIWPPVFVDVESEYPYLVSFMYGTAVKR